MPTAVLMPKLGLTMEEGTILRWIKHPGDRVASGDVIAEIETDKATALLEAEVSGTLSALLYQEGTSVPVGQAIAYLVGPGEVVSSPAPAARPAVAQPAREQPPDAPARAPRAGAGPASASPRARRVADELGIDLSTVKGTGPGGRIVEEDVRRAAQTSPKPSGAATAPTAPATRAVASGGVTPLDGIRRIVAERMVHSFTTAPHFYLTAEIDASALVKLRDDASASGGDESRPTVSDVLITVVAQALQDHPEVNAAWTDGGVRRLDTVDIGLAIATDRGLVVAVFHEANRKSLAEIARERARLAEKARRGGLALDEVQGASFTISNLGMFGVDQFNAIINPPQSAILAVGQIKPRPSVVDGRLTVRPTMFLTLSADHRILDGAEAARFLGRLAALIEGVGAGSAVAMSSTLVSRTSL